MVLIGTTDLENVPNALRFHAEHKEHCLGLYEQNTRLPIQLSALWYRLIRSAAAARKSMPVFLLGARRWTWPDYSSTEVSLACPLLALSGRWCRPWATSAFGGKRTSVIRLLMSASDPKKRTQLLHRGLFFSSPRLSFLITIWLPHGCGKQWTYLKLPLRQSVLQRRRTPC